MKTLKLPYTNNFSEEDKELIFNLRREQSSVYRSAYKMFLNGLTEKEVRHKLKEYNFNFVDSWFIQSSIKNAKGSLESLKALEKTGQKVNFNCIFGSKSQFIRRCKGFITNQEFRSDRLKDINSIGEAIKNGNRKFVLNHNSITFKPKKGIKIELLLPKLKNNYRKDYELLRQVSSNKLIPFQIKFNDEHIFITFDDKKLNGIEQKYIKDVKNNLYAGIDLNPNYIGVSVLIDVKSSNDKNYEVKETWTYDLKDLTGKNINANKLKHETIEIFHDISKRLKHLGVQIVFIEELKFDQGNKNKGKWFNRLTQNQWNRRIPFETLSKHLLCFEVNAAYSSTIGNVMNNNFYDPEASSIEIARRGYNVIVKKNRKFYPVICSNLIVEIEDRWKKTDFNFERFNWKDFHKFLKNSKMRYRVPVPDGTVFRHFNTKRSKVQILY